jgi:hypothetical protein
VHLAILINEAIHHQRRAHGMADLVRAAIAQLIEAIAKLAQIRVLDL